MVRKSAKKSIKRNIFSLKYIIILTCHTSRKMGNHNQQDPKKRRPYTSHTLATKIKHVQDFQNNSGGMSMEQYCSLHNIPKSTLSTWKKEVQSGKLNEKLSGTTIKKRDVSGEYLEVEKKLVEYIKLRNERYERDYCGLSWLFMHEKALQFAAQVLDEESLANFKASSGWISRVLKRNDLVGVRLTGESGEVNIEDAEKEMSKFRKEVLEAMNKHKINVERRYNADQTGLFYQRLPNRIYCDRKLRNTIRGVKQMKDKSR